MRLRVMMGLGDKPSNEELVDELCTTNPVCRERGRNYLSRNGVDKIQYEMVLPYRTLPLPGALVEVHDAELAESFQAKMVGWSIEATAQKDTEAATVKVNLSLERPLL